MNIRDLKYLIALEDHHHFGKAAEACFVSQPALSMQIKKLEDTLGVLLIERTNKKIIFTDVGKLIVQQAREILYHIDAMKEVANQSKDPFCGELHLGIIPTLAPYLLPRIMPELPKVFPKVTPYLTEEKTADLLTKLEKGKLDAALVALPVEGNFSVLPLFDEAFFLAVPLKHPLSKQKIVNLSDLEKQTLFLLEDGHCLRDQALAVCHKSNAHESKSFRATSLETLRYMVASGVGITLMPELSCRSNDGIHYLPFSSTIPMRTIGLIFRESVSKKALLEHLASHIKTVIQSNASGWSNT